MLRCVLLGSMCLRIEIDRQRPVQYSFIPNKSVYFSLSHHVNYNMIAHVFKTFEDSFFSLLFSEHWYLT